MSDTAVPDIQWTDTGLVLPLESAVLAGVQSDINGAFGGNLNPALNTPQGQLATSTTAIIADKNSAIAQLVDQVDPDNATGFMQDAIGRIYFMNREGGTSTVLQEVCVGQVGVTIPVGAQIIDQNQNIYTCTTGGTFGPSGTMTLPFACTQVGPIACPANTTRIYIGINGWDTATNPSAGVPGTNIESPADFEFRRQNSVAKNANGSIQAIYGNVFDVPGVIDCFVSENVTDNTISGAVNGNPNSTNYSLLPHSIYVAVTGGAGADIANAIWQKKNDGSNYNGNTTVSVQDTSGYSFPIPTYAITFEIPTATPQAVIVNIKNSGSLPSSIVQDVQTAVVAQFNGSTTTQTAAGITIQTTGQRVRIGSLFLASQFYGPIATCEGPGVPVSVLQVLLGSIFTGTASISIGTQNLSVTVATGSVFPGAVVTMSGVPAGTYIVKQISGTANGTGVYLISAQATANEASTAVTGAGGTSVQIGIDQQPTLQASNVTVNLV